MAFSSHDRFNKGSHVHVGVNKLSHKGRHARHGGASPFHIDSGPSTPSKADLQKGLSELGIHISPQQLDKLRSMGGADVLKSIVTIGGNDGSGEQKQRTVSQPTSSSSKAPAAAGRSAQMEHKSSESVNGLLCMPDANAESRRFVASGDDTNDQDRVVTGLQSDRHRHYEKREMGRKKTERNALKRLKACGADSIAVFQLMSGGDKGGITNGNEIITKEELRRGLTQIAGVQLSSSDLNSLVKTLDPMNEGKIGISLNQFSQAMSTVPVDIRPKTSRAARQHHIDTINLTNKKTLDPMQQKIQHRQNTMANIDSKLSKRFGTDPNRLRRLYIALDRNGDGTISTISLKNGLKQLGMGVSDSEFNELLSTVRDVQKNAASVPTSMGDGGDGENGGDDENGGESNDIYFSDLVHAFEKEVSMSDHTQSLEFWETDHPLHLGNSEEVMTNHEHHKRGYVNDEETCLPTHHIHVEREKRYNPFDELPQGKQKTKFRPKQHTDE